MKILLAIVLLSSLALSSGCATILKGNHQRISVTSEPSGARVRINGSDVGETPYSAKVNSSHAQTVEVKKEGYSPRTIVLASTIGVGWIVVDVLCGFVPVIVDAATGSWNVLENDDIHVRLDAK